MLESLADRVQLLHHQFEYIQEEEQKHLEEEMQKRRERIEKWRQERKKQQELVPINISQPAKQWTLEDDEDEDDEEVNNGGEADEEVDPLDAYMQVKNDCTVKWAGKNVCKFEW